MEPFFGERYIGTVFEGRMSGMTFGIIAVQPLVALIAGILVLIVPRMLNFIVAIYLIIIGLTGLMPHLMR